MMHCDKLVEQIEMFHVNEQESNEYSSTNRTTRQSKIQQERLCHSEEKHIVLL